MVEEYEDMSDEEIAEEEREEVEEKEEELKDAEDSLGGYPPSIEKPSAFQFFSKAVDTRDSSKISNLTNEELGGTRLSVRDYQSMGWFAENIKQNKLAKYFYGKAEVTLSTGLSRRGFLMNLAVTQRKEMKRAKKEVPNKWTKTRE